MKREQEIFPYIAHLLNGAEVEWKPLGEVCSFRNGFAFKSNKFREKGEAILRIGNIQNQNIQLNDLKYFNKSDYKENLSSFIVRKGDILIAMSGATTGKIGMLKSDQIFYLNQRVGKFEPIEEVLNNSFLYHYLLSKTNDLYILAGGGAQPNLSSTVLMQKLLIPLPPLSVQQEIVRILDKFTQLEAELEAELDCRKRQYEYYRDELLTSDKNEVEWKTLGEVGTFVRGKGLQKKDLIASGVPAIHYGQIYTYYGVYAYKTKSFVSEDFAQKARKAQCGDLVIAMTSENDEDVCKAVAWLGDEKVVVSSDACFYTHTMNPKYVAYYFQTEHFQKQKKVFITGTKVRRVNADDLAKITIPIPPIEEQERIAGILDKFDTLVNSISEGLPREIELRRKQYEYYREKLLSFPTE